MDFYVEFDLVKQGFCYGYFLADTLEECKEQVINHLKMCGGGSADIYNDDGEYVDYVEY